MRPFKLFVLVAASLALTGCIASSTLIKIKADGSGTIEQTMAMSAAAASQLTEMMSGVGRAFGDTKTKTPELFSEADARKMASRLGEGVTYVSSEKIQSGDRVGIKAVYAFRDITRLKVDQQPATPGAEAAAGAGLTMKPTAAEDMTFRFARQADGNSVLTILFPEPKFGAGGQPAADAASPEQVAMQTEMMKQMFKGLRIDIAVEVDGRIISTTSPYVEGQKVTLVEMDFERVLGNEAALAKLRAPKSIEEAKSVLKDVPGIKVNLDFEVRVEFVGK